MPELKRRSHSQADQYSRCALSYKLQRIDKVPQMKAAWFGHGTAGHSAVEDWERSGRTIDIVAAFERHYQTNMDSDLAKQPDEYMWIMGGRKGRDEDMRKRYWDGRDQVTAYAQRALSEDWEIWTKPGGAPALEVAFEVVYGQSLVVGYIDQVREYPDGTLRVVDLKFGSKKPDSSQQLGLYARALHHIYGVDVADGSFHMARDDREIVHNLSEWTDDKFADIFAELERGLAAQEFPANTAACFTCTSKRSCPATLLVDIGEYPITMQRRQTMKTIATVRRSGHYTAVDVISDGRRVGHWKHDDKYESVIQRAAKELAAKGWDVLDSFSADGVTVMELV